MESMVKRRLERQLGVRPCTLLGVGPMSRACVDATIELAEEHGTPLMLIASRRQIDAAELGGGYVENWTTEEFCAYVRRRDRRGRIVLCRDHGGPWQGAGEPEADLSVHEAMERARRSYEADIRSGMSVIHLDPSIDPYGPPRPADVLERLFELYEYCWALACELRHDVVFEIGTEEQMNAGGDLRELERTLEEVFRFCRSAGLPPPLFAVVQTGTKVAETRNVGSFDSPYRIAGELPAEIHIPRVLAVLRRYDVHLKQHNTDYLSDEVLSWMPRLGVPATNVAPEFGVAETRALLEVLGRYGLTALRDRFLEIAYASGKWKKWMLANSTATDTDRAVIAGHYVFAAPECREVLAAAERDLAGHGVDLHRHLKDRVKVAILRYMTKLRLVNGR